MKTAQNATKNYELGELLGSGAFGKVYKCRSALTNQDYAIKIVPKSTLDHPVLHELMRQELQVLANVNHPNIMRIYELLEDDNNYYVVSEIICGGELFDQIIKKGKLSYLESAKIIKQTLMALAHMHEQGIVHRDLKPENILMVDDDNIKVADFGFAVPLKGKKQTQVLGSPLYMAPELVLGKEYSSEVDIWAMGVITHILLTGTPPFSGATKDEIFNSICNKKP